MAALFWRLAAESKTVAAEIRKGCSNQTFSGCSGTLADSASTLVRSPSTLVDPVKHLPSSRLFDLVTVIAPERELLAVVLVRPGEVVGGTMEEGGHAWHDDLAHVGGAPDVVRRG